MTAVLLATALGMSSVTAARADSLVLAPDSAAESLPDLPGANAATSWDFALAEKRAELGYDSPIEKWSARLDRSMGLRPALSVDYGLQLTSTLGAGAVYTRNEERSEIVLNGVYAARRSLRFRVATAQLRTTPGHSGDGNAFQQNSYLVGARKYWASDSFFSDAGVTLYTAGASMGAANLAALGDPDLGGAGEMRSDALAPGRMQGYTINLSLRPLPSSRLDLRRDTSDLTYYLDAGRRRKETLASHRIAYSQRLDNCLQVQGGFSTADDVGRVDIGVTRNNWNLRWSRERDGSSSATSVQIGYVLPLGGTRRDATRCTLMAESAPAFGPLVDAAISRPSQIPQDPVASTQE